MLFKRIRIYETLDALAGAEVEVVVALGANLQIFGEREVVNDFAAGRALGPETARHLTGFVAECSKDGCFKDGHGVNDFLAARECEGTDGFRPLLQKDSCTGIEGRSGGEDIVNEQ